MFSRADCDAIGASGMEGYPTQLVLLQPTNFYWLVFSLKEEKKNGFLFEKKDKEFKRIVKIVVRYYSPGPLIAYTWANLKKNNSQHSKNQINKSKHIPNEFPKAVTAYA
jgi:hypothetical protein